MAICSAIFKYGIDKFSFYILEIIEKPELDLLSYKNYYLLEKTIGIVLLIHHIIFKLF